MMRTLSDTLNRIILTRITETQQKDAIRNINPILKPLSLVIIAVSISLSVLSLGTAAKATTFEFEQKLLAPDGVVSGGFGNPVAIDRNLALIRSASGNGSVYVFDLSTVSVIHTLTAPDGAFNNSDSFGGSTAISGNFALIGSLLDDNENGADSGSAYLFDITTGSLLQKILAPDGDISDQFGQSVSIDGNFALIGSPFDDDNGTNSGSAYLFDLATGSLLQKFTAPDGAFDDRFGFSVAIDGNFALIGSPFDDDNGTNSGSIYMFDVSTGNLIEKFTAPDGAANDILGFFPSSIDGNFALIGSFRDDDNGIDSGSAYLFDVTNGSLVHKFTAPDSSAQDQFGNTVHLDANYALIGSSFDDDNGIDSGSAYLFDVTTGSFLQKLIAPDGAADDLFGQSVAINGNNILIGSPFDDDNGTDSGSAYLFTVESVTPERVPETSSIISIVSLLGLGALVKKR